MLEADQTQNSTHMRKASTTDQRLETPCPLCESRKYTVIYEPWVQVDDPHTLYGAASGVSGTQRIVKCNDCEMMFENPRYSEALILKGYSSAKDDGHDSQYALRVLSFKNTLQSLQKQRLIAKSGLEVLDIGTASGAFLEAAQQCSYRATGLEPSHFLVEQGKKRHLDIRQGTIEKNSLGDKQFDLICMWDVIEHLSDPKGSLLQIKKHLKLNGILLLNIPDSGTLQAKLAGKRFWWHLSVHLHYFTKKTLGQLCANTGLEVFHTQRYWQTLSFGYLMEIAVKLKLPLARLALQITPKFIKAIPIKYYASQTTVLARFPARGY